MPYIQENTQLGQPSIESSQKSCSVLARFVHPFCSSVSQQILCLALGLLIGWHLHNGHLPEDNKQSHSVLLRKVYS